MHWHQGHFNTRMVAEEMAREIERGSLNDRDQRILNLRAEAERLHRESRRGRRWWPFRRR